MANGTTYVLMGVPLTANQGGNTAQVQVLVTDGLTGATTILTASVPTPGPTVQAHIDALVAAAQTYLAARYPGITVTLPPAPSP